MDPQVPNNNNNQSTNTDEGNRYDDIFATEVGEEYKECKAEYKAARKKCKTQAEKKMLMQAYMDDLIDLAVDARTVGEMELNKELNTIVRSLSRRTYGGRSSW
tara:strand:- start:317 stop:625 length:309 start_codon:yes stop_codon:yes gene_type:complete